MHHQVCDEQEIRTLHSNGHAAGLRLRSAVPHFAQDDSCGEFVTSPKERAAFHRVQDVLLETCSSGIHLCSPRNFARGSQ
jgi:hypothetical protein